MADEVIEKIDQVTTGWLTGVLVECGSLRQGAVAGFEIDTGRGNWSTNAILKLHYSEGSLGDFPRRLFLKLVNTDLDGESFGPSEVSYYTRDYVNLDKAPLVRCYSGVYSEQRGRYHLLLDDHTQTHITAAQKEPDLTYGLALAEGLAMLHAHWWGADRLDEAGAAIHEADHIQRFVDIAEPGLEHILRWCSDDLKAEWPSQLLNLFARHPQAIIERTREANGFTLIHGDAGQTNILVPREGDWPLYIIDRQPFDWSLTSWLGVYDLAYAMVLDWPVEIRRQLEIPVLRHYHTSLSRFGVADYTWERLLDDYRLCVAMGVYIATEYCRGGLHESLRWLWMRMLQNTLTACDDLSCSELWEV